MSWKFAGIIFKKDYSNSYPDLLQQLGVSFSHISEGLTFFDAIRRDNPATTFGRVHGNTLLLHHLLPYDCSYEVSVQGRLDDILLRLSHQCNIVNFIVDGVSGTYCFSVFRKGMRVRRWAVEPGRIWCDEGKPLRGELPDASRNDDTPSPSFVVSEDEVHLFRLWKTFVGVSFQEFVDDDRPIFCSFL